MDYDSGPYTVTFSAGETRALFNISINNDNIFEMNENFALTINGSSLPTGVTVSTPNETIVTIVDNEGKYLVKLISKFESIQLAVVILTDGIVPA